MTVPKYVTRLVAIALSTLCSSVVFAESVTFSRVTGSVRVEVAGAPVEVRNGSVLKTPVRIVTGADGALHIEQVSSSLDIGPDSVIVVPGTSPQSGVEKILQELGRVLYSVKPRKSGTFTVETPYLVSVVKGTTFSVAIDDASTAVTLLEGLIEVSGPGTQDRAVLQPNQRAVRVMGAADISVSIVDTTAAVSVPRVPSNSAPTAFHIPDPSEEALDVQPHRATDDLGQITAAQVDVRPSTNLPGNEPTVPSTPDEPELPLPVPLPPPQPDVTPSNPAPPIPDITPAPQPDPTPTPAPMPDDHDDDDDGNNGHGNDDDGRDDSNPGNRP